MDTLSKQVDSGMSKRPGRADKSSCPISFGLDIFGDRWTLLVLRDLVLHGKTRFAEMQASDEGIASNILADRLQRLECMGLVERIPDPEDRRQKICRVTAKGLTLTPVLLEIAAWGASNDPNTGAPTGFASAFYEDRQSFYDEHQRLIAELFERDVASKPL